MLSSVYVYRLCVYGPLTAMCFGDTVGRTACIHDLFEFMHDLSFTRLKMSTKLDVRRHMSSIPTKILCSLRSDRSRNERCQNID